MRGLEDEPLIDRAGEVAHAFLEGKCGAYLGPIQDVEEDTGALFGVGFFYHLLSID